MRGNTNSCVMAVGANTSLEVLYVEREQIRSKVRATNNLLPHCCMSVFLTVITTVGYAALKAVSHVVYLFCNWWRGGELPRLEHHTTMVCTALLALMVVLLYLFIDHTVQQYSKTAWRYLVSWNSVAYVVFCTSAVLEFTYNTGWLVYAFMSLTAIHVVLPFGGDLLECACMCMLVTSSIISKLCGSADVSDVMVLVGFTVIMCIFYMTYAEPMLFAAIAYCVLVVAHPLIQRASKSIWMHLVKWSNFSWVIFGMSILVIVNRSVWFIVVCVVLVTMRAVHKCGRKVMKRVCRNLSTCSIYPHGANFS